MHPTDITSALERANTAENIISNLEAVIDLKDKTVSSAEYKQAVHETRAAIHLFRTVKQNIDDAETQKENVQHNPSSNAQLFKYLQYAKQEVYTAYAKIPSCFN